MRPLLVVNPRSGGGRTGAVFDQLKGPIEAKLGEVDVAMTERGRHAVELARDAALAGRETIVAVGGDGLIHEVVNGLMEAKATSTIATKLGVIGQGTGGDFRKTLLIEHRLDKYLDAIASGKTRAVDVGAFSYDDHRGEPQRAYFINILSVGLGGLVDQYVASSGRMLGGKFAYFAASVKSLFSGAIGRLRCTLTMGGETRAINFESRSVALCNGRFFGSGMEVAPMAVLDDGILEVIDLGAAPLTRFAMKSSKIYSGKHLELPEVKHHRCESIRIELDNEEVKDRFLLDVDGEPLGTLPIDVRLEKKAVEVFVP